MPAPRDTAVIVRAARLYYEQGHSQTQVAAELGLSRSNVSRILTQARDRGIVEITIHDPEGPPRRDDALEAALRASFSLREAHVVSAPRTTGMEAVAREGAALLVERAPHVGSIGVSWGQTVQSVVEQLETQNLRPRHGCCPWWAGTAPSISSTLGSRCCACWPPAWAPARRPCTPPRCLSRRPRWRRCARSRASGRCWLMPRRWSWPWSGWAPRGCTPPRTSSV